MKTIGLSNINIKSLVWLMFALSSISLTSNYLSEVSFLDHGHLHQHDLKGRIIQSIVQEEADRAIGRIDPQTPKRRRPIHILNEYMSQHSKRAIRADPYNRKFMVAEYRCPFRAGNMMGNFLNTFLLAVATNRTVLWNYFGSEEEKANCHHILERAEWIEAYHRNRHGPIHQWRQREDLFKGCSTVFGVERHFECQEHIDEHPELAVELTSDLSEHKALSMRGVTGCLHTRTEGWEGRFDLSQGSCFDYVQRSLGLIDQERVNHLFAHGMDFLYGLLWDRTFSLTDELAESVQLANNAIVNSTAFTVGVHSRHPDESDEGVNIKSEVDCIDKMMNKMKKGQYDSCQFLIMSDRPATVSAISQYVEEKHSCQGVYVVHNTSSCQISEHGPFCDSLFSDISLVRQAQHGFIGHPRSSSALVLQEAVYRAATRPKGDREFFRCYTTMEGFRQKHDEELRKVLKVVG